jgi:hypothetical protein
LMQVRRSQQRATTSREGRCDAQVGLVMCTSPPRLCCWLSAEHLACACGLRERLQYLQAGQPTDRMASRRSTASLLICRARQLITLRDQMMMAQLTQAGGVSHLTPKSAAVRKCSLAAHRQGHRTCPLVLNLDSDIYNHFNKRKNLKRMHIWRGSTIKLHKGPP